MQTKHLLYLGFIIPFIFWITTIISGFVFGSYNHLTRMVSELGAIGTSSRFIFSSGLIICSVLSLLFVKGLYKIGKTTKLSVIPVLIILTYSVSIAGAAIFPLPLRLHEIMGMPSILLVLSPLLSLFLWRDNSQLVFVRVFSILSFAIMALGFSVFMPDILDNYIGVKQRLFHIGWSMWFIYLSFSFIKLLGKPKSI